MAKKIKNVETRAKVRTLVYYVPGNPTPWRITNQIDHTWFLTVFGTITQQRPFDANEFIEFVHKNYDKKAVLILDDYGVVSKCAPTVYFAEQEQANRFLDDFTEALEQLIG